MVFRQRNSQRFEMDMSAAEVKRAASAPPQTNSSGADVINGAEIIVRCLQAEGVKYLWGYPGGAVLYIYDALYKQQGIEHVLVRHEQAAVHAADGYARATGEVGVALVTSGPGVTNAVTGIATAYMDSIPMVIITGPGADAGDRPRRLPGVRHGGHHAPDRQAQLPGQGRARPGADDEEGVPHRAHRPARAGGGRRAEGRVAARPTPFSYPARVEMRSYNPVRKGHGGQIRKAVQLLLAAPSGRTSTPAAASCSAMRSAELRELADLLGLPCTNTLMGLGAMPSSDPKFLGMLGMHGTYEANMTMQNCDVLLAVGARFDDRVIGNPKHFASVERKIIHVDIDPSSISKRVRVDIPIVGDVKDVLQRADRADQGGASQARRGVAVGVVGPDQRVAQARVPELQAQQRGDQAAAGGGDAVAADARQRCLHHLRRRASTRCGPRSTTASRSRVAGSTRGGLGTMGVGSAVCDGHQAGQAARPTCSASPAKARSRCASRSCRPACSTRRR